MKLPFENLDQLTAAVVNVDFKWHLTWERVCGAANANAIPPPAKQGVYPD